MTARTAFKKAAAASQPVFAEWLAPPSLAEILHTPCHRGRCQECRGSGERTAKRECVTNIAKSGKPRLNASGVSATHGFPILEIPR